MFWRGSYKREFIRAFKTVKDSSQGFVRQTLFRRSSICELLKKKKVKLSLYRPWRPLGFREVEAPTFSDIRLIDGDKVASPTRRPRFTRRKIPSSHFC
jgi:hypothetical protein